MLKSVKIGSVVLPEFPLLLAPMEDVSDPPFRALCKEQGCDLMYTEFISVEGLIRDAEKSLQKLDIYDEERPIGVQIFGAEYESMMKAAEIVERANPEILDINYGCPVQKVVCKMAGAGILKDVPKMVKLTEAVVKSTNLPVTVKTRLGWDDSMIFIEDVAERLQDIGIKALTIHARTRSQMYKGDADWSWIAKVKNNPRIHIPIFGNGDIDNPQKALDYKNRYGVDGIMIGRASIGYPWIFREIKHFLKTGNYLDPPTIIERVHAAKTHLSNSIKWKGEKLGILEMRRHYTNYFKGLANIKEYRARLVAESNPEILYAILDQMQEEYSMELSCVLSE
ncbi:MAG: tRNA dihydrouridine synthase DusB [Saprospiraceae bacterium]|nr:tRNA dihydrouridine synthase DusB [Saprospiraceae bacterium]MBK8483907.1 tRNA dihydrouridine synthase DusB [Saprospiraceae bacterium]MBK9221314.1 tRNA dihydrouridine synthase DusB [Saprospiraceae bacterium]MBK9721751.1 tRNA dihydrouridine synthase DusB [Saprospiraceae bacterium]MBK9728812.1 tRNA dihydrouridine synthase DusB [Saprospiraceae bacterium]